MGTGGTQSRTGQGSLPGGGGVRADWKGGVASVLCSGAEAGAEAVSAGAGLRGGQGLNEDDPVALLRI